VWVGSKESSRDERMMYDRSQALRWRMGVVDEDGLNAACTVLSTDLPSSQYLILYALHPCWCPVSADAYLVFRTQVDVRYVHVER